METISDTSLEAKRRFVNATTHSRYRKYIDDKNFLTPIKSTGTRKDIIAIEETIKSTSTPKKPIKSTSTPKKPIKSASTPKDIIAIEETITLDPNTRENARLLTDTDIKELASYIIEEMDPNRPMKEIDPKQPMEKKETKKKKLKDETPDWAKLVMSSSLPNNSYY